MAVKNIVAVDLGAFSCQVMLATWQVENRQLALKVENRQLALKEIHRFTNRLVEQDGHHLWDLDALEQEIPTGLYRITDSGIRPDSIVIDSWCVDDYVLLDATGERVDLPYAYRDHRTDGVMAQAIAELGAEHIYHLTGIQFLPFNSLYQLKVWCSANISNIDSIAHFLMIPDYLHYHLTGSLSCEYTNASTTQLLNLHIKNWDASLLAWLDLPARWFSTPAQPGKTLGAWTSPASDAIPVITVATHDTSGAVD